MEWRLWGRMAVSPSVVKQNDSCQTLGQNYIILCHSSTWKRCLQTDIIVFSSNCRPCCFQSVWNTKNVCFLVCIFSANLQRLFENHRSDLKIIIFKMRKEKKGKITLVFICLDFISKGKLICKNFKPIIRHKCTHPHLQISASLPLPQLMDISARQQDGCLQSCTIEA